MSNQDEKVRTALEKLFRKVSITDLIYANALDRFKYGEGREPSADSFCGFCHKDNFECPGGCPEQREEEALDKP